MVNTSTELSEEEYLQKLKEIRMMNAQERKHLYEKYGRARSNLERNNKKMSSGSAGEKVATLGEKMATWMDFSDILHHRSGRKTANSDTFIINDLNLVDSSDLIQDSSEDDDNDVVITKPVNSKPFNPVNIISVFKKSPVKKSGSVSSEDSNDSSEIEAPSMLYQRTRRRSSLLENLKNFLCVSTSNSIIFESFKEPPKSPMTEETSMGQTLNSLENTLNLTADESSPTKTDHSSTGRSMETSTERYTENSTDRTNSGSESSTNRSNSVSSSFLFENDLHLRPITEESELPPETRHDVTPCDITENEIQPSETEKGNISLINLDADSTKIKHPKYLICM